MTVEALNLEVVVEDVAAHLWVVRKEWRNSHILEPQAAAEPGSFLVTAVRIVAAKPKAERGAEWIGVVEGLEVVISWTGGVASASAGLDPSRAPALAGIANVISRRLEQVGIGGELGGQGTPQVDALFKAIALLPRQDGSTGWGA